MQVKANGTRTTFLHNWAGLIAVAGFLTSFMLSKLADWNLPAPVNARRPFQLSSGTDRLTVPWGWLIEIAWRTFASTGSRSAACLSNTESAASARASRAVSTSTRAGPGQSRPQPHTSVSLEASRPRWSCSRGARMPAI